MWRARDVIRAFPLFNHAVQVLNKLPGESAGASAVGFHLVAYGGRNDSIISGGIMESGNSVPYEALWGTDHYQPLYQTIVNRTGCTNASDTLGCLRALPFDTLNAAVNTSSSGRWFPVIDGDFIQKYPSIQLANGEFLKVPIIRYVHDL